MSKLQQVEEAVRHLSAVDLAAFRAWFAEYDATAWDRQLEEDVQAGRLDVLADQALRELREGPLENVRARLEAERCRINAEIRSYPTPIAGCDEQFNYLLQERSRLTEELARLDAL